MSTSDEQIEGEGERSARILAMREAGASWKEIGETFGLTRQASRYAYQVAKRAERRSARRERR